MTDDRLTAEERVVIEAALALHRAKTNPPGTHGGVAILDKARRDFEDATLALYVKLTPPRCEPPEGVRETRGWYWLKRERDGELLPAEWIEVSNWRWVINARHVLREDVAADGWRCIAPCLPPGSEPEKVEISDAEVDAIWCGHCRNYPIARISDFARAVLARFTLPAMTDDEIVAAWLRVYEPLIFPESNIPRLVKFARIVRGEKAE